MLGPVHRFVSLINLLVPSFENILQYRNNKNIPKTPRYSKTPLHPDYTQAQNKFGIEDDNDTKKSQETKTRLSVQKQPPTLKAATCTNRPIGSQGKSMYWFLTKRSLLKGASGQTSVSPLFPHYQSDFIVDLVLVFAVIVR